MSEHVYAKNILIYFAIKIHREVFSVEQYSVKLSFQNFYKPQIYKT